MESSFECPICLDEFSVDNKPLMMPCGHTACSDCLSTISSREERMVCPTCREHHRIQQVSQLPVNYALIDKQTSKASKEAWEGMQRTNMQITQIKRYLETIENDFKKAQEFSEGTQADIIHKIDVIMDQLGKYKLKIRDVCADANERNLRKFTEAQNYLHNVERDRTDLLGKLKIAYDSSSELSIDSKLAIDQLGDNPSPSVNFNICVPSIDEDPLVTSVLNIKIGTIKIVEQTEERKENPTPQHSENQRVNAANDTGNRRKTDRFGGAKWLIRNRFGTLEGLKPFICEAIEKGLQDEGNVIQVYDNRNHLVNRIYKDTKKISMVDKRGRDIHMKDLIFNTNFANN